MRVLVFDNNMLYPGIVQFGMTSIHSMYNVFRVSAYVCIVPQADQRQQTVQRQWSGGGVCLEGQATGLSGARRASQSDSCRLCARAEGT